MPGVWLVLAALGASTVTAQTYTCEDHRHSTLQQITVRVLDSEGQLVSGVVVAHVDEVPFGGPQTDSAAPSRSRQGIQRLSFGSVA